MRISLSDKQVQCLCFETSSQGSVDAWATAIPIGQHGTVGLVSYCVLCPLHMQKPLAFNTKWSNSLRKNVCSTLTFTHTHTHADKHTHTHTHKITHIQVSNQIGKTPQDICTYSSVADITSHYRHYLALKR